MLDVPFKLYIVKLCLNKERKVSTYCVAISWFEKMLLGPIDSGPHWHAGLKRKKEEQEDGRQYAVIYGYLDFEIRNGEQALRTNDHLVDKWTNAPLTLMLSFPRANLRASYH